MTKNFNSVDLKLGECEICQCILFMSLLVSSSYSLMGERLAGTKATLFISAHI